jgi:hypothetical protein
MKKYRFGYLEVIHNYKTIEINLDDEVNPSLIADSLTHIDELINWDEDCNVTNESEITFIELDLKDDANFPKVKND